MKLTKTIVTTLIIGSILSCSTIKRLENTPIGLINNVSYINSKFNNSNASNGFLVKYNNTTYAVTAKHVLMIAKSKNMKFVDFEGELKQWKMHPKHDTTKYVIIDKLLSTNKKDSLTWNYMNTNWDTYNDWLVFSIKKNKTNHSPLKYRRQPLKKGENLYAVGWTYKDSIGKQRVYEYKFDAIEGNYYSLLQIKGPKSLGGLSGSPIVDNKGRIVGLVSSGWEDEKTKKTYLQATNIKSVFKFIHTLNK